MDGVKNVASSASVVVVVVSVVVGTGAVVSLVTVVVSAISSQISEKIFVEDAVFQHHQVCYIDNVVLVEVSTL